MLTSLRRAEDRHQASSTPDPRCASGLAAPPPREVAGAEPSPRSSGPASNFSRGH